MNSAKVAVLGAGVSGLIAALELEAKGFHPILIEASDRVGGRLRSDQHESIALDHGFQVLLTNYPELKRYQLLSALQLKEFRPGALIFEDQDPHRIGDAFRDLGFLGSTVFSSVATLRDKITLLREQRRLAQTRPEAVFAQTREQTTLDYLSERYSDRFIELFFKPFYSGIFLESVLSTSYKHFEFVFHHFALGKAALVVNGIQRLPELLASRLTQTEIKLNTAFDESEIEKYDALVQTYPNTTAPADYNGCINCYFEIESADEGLLKQLETTIGLIPHSDYVNNLHVLSAGDRQLLSATVVGQVEMGHSEIEGAVRQELLERCAIAVGKAVKTYTIRRALPRKTPMQYKAKVQQEGAVFYAGDYSLYPSLNAAMQSGRAAAEAVSRHLNR